MKKNLDDIHTFLTVFHKPDQLTQPGHAIGSILPFDQVDNTVRLVTKLCLRSLNSTPTSDDLQLCLKHISEQLANSLKHSPTSTIQSVLSIAITIRIYSKLLKELKPAPTPDAFLLTNLLHFLVAEAPSSIFTALSHSMRKLFKHEQTFVFLDVLYQNIIPTYGKPSAFAAFITKSVVIPHAELQNTPKVFSNLFTLLTDAHAASANTPKSTPTDSQLLTCTESLVALYLPTLSDLKHLEDTCEDKLKSTFNTEEVSTFSHRKDFLSQERSHIQKLLKLLITTHAPTHANFSKTLTNSLYSRYLTLATFPKTTPTSHTASLLTFEPLDSLKFIDLCIAHDFTTAKASILTTAKFWSDLSNWLMDTDTKVRKVSIYILSLIARLEHPNAAPDHVFRYGWEIFFSAFSTLDCFGVHLVKAVTQAIQVLINLITKPHYATQRNAQPAAYRIYDLEWGLSMLLRKTAEHNNFSVRRHIVKNILKTDVLTIDAFPNFIFNELLPVLNGTCYYKDFETQKVTKFAKLLQIFFANQLKQRTNDELPAILRKLFDVTFKQIDCAHAMSGVLAVFRQSSSNVTFINSPDDVQTLISYKKRNYAKLPLRKKFELITSMLLILTRHADLTALPTDVLIHFLQEIPTDLLQLISSNQQPSPDLIAAFDRVLENTEAALIDASTVSLLVDENALHLLAVVFLNRFTTHFSIIDSHIAPVFREQFWNNPKAHLNDHATFSKLLVILSKVQKDISHTTAPLTATTSFSKDALIPSIQKLEQLLIFPLFPKLSAFYSSAYLPFDQVIATMSVYVTTTTNTLEHLLPDTRDKILNVTLPNIIKDIISYLRILILDEDVTKLSDVSYHLATLTTFTRVFFDAVLTSPTLSHSQQTPAALMKLIADFTKSAESQLATSPPNMNVDVLLHVLAILNNFLDSLSSHHATLSPAFLHDLTVAHVPLFTQLIKCHAELRTKRELLVARNKFCFSFSGLTRFINTADPFASIAGEASQTLYEEMTSLIEGLHLHDIENGLNSLEKGYLPHFLTMLHLSKSQPNEQQQLWTDFSTVVTKLAGIIIDSDVYTPSHVTHLFKFTLNRSVILAAADSPSGKATLDKLHKKLFKLATQRFFLARAYVNRLYALLQPTPNANELNALLTVLRDIIAKFIRYRELRSFDAKLHDDKTQSDYIPTTGHMKRPRLPNHINADGLYPRFLIFQLLDQLLSSDTQKDHLTFFSELIVTLLEFNLKGKYLSPKFSTMPYSIAHRKKIGVWQALCLLSRVFQVNKPTAFVSGYLDRVQNTMWTLLNANNLPSIRQYIELFSTTFIKSFPELAAPAIAKHFENKALKAQFGISLAFIVGYLIETSPDTSETFKLLSDRRILHRFFNYTCSNTAYLRAIAQFFTWKFLSKYPPESTSYLTSLVNYFIDNKDVVSMKEKIDGLTQQFTALLNNFSLDYLIATPMDDQSEIVHDSVIERIKEQCAELQKKIREGDLPPPKDEEIWKHRLEALLADKPDLKNQVDTLTKSVDRAAAGGDGNASDDEEGKEQAAGPVMSDIFQRKTHTAIENVIEEDIRARVTFDSEIIVVATLLDKLPNFANLTRTCEVMGISCLAIPNKKLVENEEFKVITVTAEQWLPIIEVRERDLGAFLVLKKQEGFEILGLEQTSRSTMLQEFKFPKKCVLLLGKEREGIPLEYLEILDHCIEIPQFGMIRSLNVHISAVICLWEFVKQQYIKK